MVRIIVAVQNATALWAMKTMLQEQPDITMVGEAADGEALLTAAELQEADLILVDSKLPRICFANLLARLHALMPRPFVVAIGSHVEDLQPALDAGADGFFSQIDGPDGLLNYVRHFDYGTRS